MFWIPWVSFHDFFRVFLLLFQLRVIPLSYSLPLWFRWKLPVAILRVFHGGASCVDSLRSVPLVGEPAWCGCQSRHSPRLAAATLVEGAGDGGAAHCGGGRRDSAHHQSVRGRGWSRLEPKPQPWAWASLIPLSVCFSFSRLPGRFP